MNRGAERTSQLPDSGMIVSIRGKSKQVMAATVTARATDEIVLQLSPQDGVLSFHKGEKVGLKYWHEGATVYCWDAEVMSVYGTDRRLRISMSDTPFTVQRRKSYRASSRVSFSFTVIEAAKAQLNGEQASEATALDIGVGGLTFETALPLGVGDKLDMSVSLSRSRHISAVAWVVRSDAIQRGSADVHSIGLQFLQLNEEEQRELLEFLVSSRTVNGARTDHQPSEVLGTPPSRHSF